jgi:hypothetical protein
VIITVVNMLAVKSVSQSVGLSVCHADDRLINQSITYAASPKLAIQFVSFLLTEFCVRPKNIFFLFIDS